MSATLGALYIIAGPTPPSYKSVGVVPVDGHIANKLVLLEFYSVQCSLTG